MIEQSTRRIPCTEDIEIEASRLFATLNPRFVEAAQENAFKEQINIICEQLDAETDILQRVLSDVDDKGDTLDIRGELERAWLLDQLKILESKEKLLDVVCTCRQWHIVFELASDI